MGRIRDSAMHGSNIELECLDESEAAPFAFEIIGMVEPEVVFFSNHRTKSNHRHREVVAAITKVAGRIPCPAGIGI